MTDVMPATDPRRRRRGNLTVRRSAALALLVAVSLALAACGEDQASSDPEDVFAEVRDLEARLIGTVEELGAADDLGGAIGELEAIRSRSEELSEEVADADLPPAVADELESAVLKEVAASEAVLSLATQMESVVAGQARGITAGSTDAATDAAPEVAATREGAELKMIELQSLVSQRQAALQLVANLTRAVENASKAILGNVDGGGTGPDLRGASDTLYERIDFIVASGAKQLGIQPEAIAASPASQADCPSGTVFTPGEPASCLDEIEAGAPAPAAEAPPAEAPPAEAPPAEEAPPPEG